MTNKIKFFVCALLVSTSVLAQDKVWTLQECVEYALDNNISVQLSNLDIAQAELDIKDSKGRFFPTLNGNANHSWNIGLNQNVTTGVLENLTTQASSFGISSNVNLFNGFQNINRLRRANMALLLRKYQFENTKDNTALSVANSYLQVLFNKEQLKVLINQNELSKEQLKRTEDLVDNGVLPRGDLLEILATIASQEQQIINAENQINLSKISLAQLLLIKDYATFDIADVTYDVPLQTLLDSNPKDIAEASKEARYELKIAKVNDELAEQDIKISRGAMYPTLSGFYSYSTRAAYNDVVRGSVLDLANPTQQIGTVESTGEAVVSPNFNRVVGKASPLFDQLSQNDGHSFGLQLSVPIFNGFSVKNNIERTKVNAERTKHQIEQANLNIESNVYRAFNDAKAAQKSYEATQKTVEARKQAYDFSRERYNIGSLNAFDLNQSQNAYEASQSDLIRAKYDYLFKLKILEFYYGKTLY